MTVYDLNRDQLAELKQRYLAETTGRDLSYDELANIDFYVTDYDVQHEYEGTTFVNDDFFCSAGKDEEDYDDRIKFFVADTGRNETYYMHAINGVEYEWSDWAASTFSKRGAQDALAWCRKNGYKNARAITIVD